MDERIKSKLNPLKFRFNFPSTITKVERVTQSTITNINARLENKIRQDNMELIASAEVAGKFQVR